MGENLRVALKADDSEVVREIMRVTGVSTGADAVGLLVRKFGPIFLAWWNGETPALMPSSAPIATPVSTTIALTNPGENLEPIEF